MIPVVNIQKSVKLYKSEKTLDKRSNIVYHKCTKI